MPARKHDERGDVPLRVDQYLGRPAEVTTLGERHDISFENGLELDGQRAPPATRGSALVCLFSARRQASESSKSHRARGGDMRPWLDGPTPTAHRAPSEAWVTA